MTELSPEQIAEIRERWRQLDLAASVEVLALCDTADALREQLDKTANEPADRMTRRDSYQWGLAKGRNEAREELETLRGIVERVRDGWSAVRPPCDGLDVKQVDCEWKWERQRDGVIETDSMTPAEVQAIYGQKEGDDNAGN